MSSYFVRLAKYHRLPVKELYKFCFPERSADRVQTRQVSQDAASSFNGYCGDAVSVITQLSKLLHMDVSMMTLLAWQGLFDSMEKGVFAVSKRWCPLCIKESEVEHEKLLWLLKEYRVCSIHNVMLIDRCCHCGSRQPVMSAKVPIGVCHACHASLSKMESLYFDKDPRSEMVERLLALTVNNVTALKAFSIECFLPDLMSRLDCKGYKPLEQLLGFGDRTLAQWASGRYKPALTSFLDLAQVIGVSPEEMVIGNYAVEIENLKRRQAKVVRVSRSEQDRQIIQDKLEAIMIRQKEEITIKAISVQLDVGISFLNYNFPEQLKRVKFQNACFRTMRNIQRICSLRKEVSKAISLLEKNGCYPAHDKVMGIVGNNNKGLNIGEFSRVWRLAMFQRGDEID